MSQVCLFNFIGVNTVITDFFVYNIIKMVDEVEIESGSVDAFLEKEMGLTEEKRCLLKNKYLEYSFPEKHGNMEQ